MSEAAAVRILRETVPDLVAVYVFGSAATGETHAGSDVDLAVLAPRALPNLERFALQERIAVQAMVERHVDDFLAFTRVALALAA